MNITASLPYDKRLHVAVGALITLVVTLAILFAGALGAHLPAALVAIVAVVGAPMLGAFAAVVAGAAKEWVWDWVVNVLRERRNLPPLHNVDPMDFLATAAGGFFVALCIAIVMAVLLVLT